MRCGDTDLELGNVFPVGHGGKKMFHGDKAKIRKVEKQKDECSSVCGKRRLALEQH